MNEIEARSILEQELSRFRRRSYSELLFLIDDIETFERASPSGVTYQLEMQAIFDDESQRNLRVIGTIDDGGWRAWKPLGDDFIISPDGTFVGE
ncbi:MAG: hypothetical protein WAU45_11565 [Blastocatellia bacterium]